MPKQKYAMVKDKSGFIRDWDAISGKFTFTDEIDRALLYTNPGIEEHLPFLEKYDIELVPVEVVRVITGTRKHSTDLLNDVLARLQNEFDNLNQYDVDDLSDADYKYWRRLKRQIETRTVDKSAIK